MGREGEVLSELIPGFEKEHPGIHAEVQQIPWTAAHEKLLTAYVGEATPDIAMLGNTWVPEFVALNALAPLDSFADRSKDIRRDDFFPGIWKTNVVDGKTYGIPWYVDTRVIFYRTDLLANAGYKEFPKTWAEWMNAMTATATATKSAEFVMSRVFDVPRELLWECFTEPERMKAWWGAKGITITVSKMDLRPGGTYHYCMRTPDGRDMWGRMVYREIVPPERLVFINSFSDEQGGLTRPPFEQPWPVEMLSIFTFEEEPGGKTSPAKSLWALPMESCATSGSVRVASRVPLCAGETIR